MSTYFIAILFAGLICYCIAFIFLFLLSVLVGFLSYKFGKISKTQLKIYFKIKAISLSIACLVVFFTCIMYGIILCRSQGFI